jgi:hypothetical protein
MLGNGRLKKGRQWWNQKMCTCEEQGVVCHHEMPLSLSSSKLNLAWFHHTRKKNSSNLFQFFFSLSKGRSLIDYKSFRALFDFLKLKKKKKPKKTLE